VTGQVVTPEAVMETYVALWAATDEAERQRLAELALTEDAVMIYPSVEAHGRDEVIAALGKVHQLLPGVSIVSTSGVEQHHGWLRASWRMINADGTVRFDGVDIAELAEDGRFRRVIGFHDPLPPLT
jgi:SnoaL-like domain